MQVWWRAPELQTSALASWSAPSPLALFLINPYATAAAYAMVTSGAIQSGRGLPHSKTWRKFLSFGLRSGRAPSESRRTFKSSRRRGRSKAFPEAEGKQTEKDDGELAADKKHEPVESGFHEAIGMQADAEHVHAEPGKACHDIAEHGEIHYAAVADQPAPARVQDDGIPKHDQQSAVFLGIPAPETSPGLVGPDAAQDGADEAEERGKADDAINHFRQRLADGDWSARGPG